MESLGYGVWGIGNRVRAKGMEQKAEENWELRIANLKARRQKRAARHVASPSLGHNAALSLVVIGRG